MDTYTNEERKDSDGREGRALKDTGLYERTIAECIAVQFGPWSLVGGPLGKAGLGCECPYQMQPKHFPVCWADQSKEGQPATPKFIETEPKGNM